MEFVQITAKKILVYCETQERETKIRESVADIMIAIEKLQKVLEIGEK